MLTFLLILTAVAWAFYSIKKTKKAVHMLQLNSYRNERLVRWMKGNMTKVFPIKEMVVFLSLIGFLIAGKFVGLIILTVVYGLVALTSKEEQQKKKLVITKRVKRLLITFGIVQGVIVLATLIYALTTGVVGLFLLVLIAANLLTYYILMLANIINKPIENGINQHYFNDAENIIQSMNDLKVVGITGSFGKTSTKHALSKILSAHANTLMTPESFNTKLGVTITIRKYLKPYHDFFIAEMGAKQPNDIKEICDLVHHKYAILTAIGEQHLETFKTLENIKKTKYEIVETLPEDGIAFMNMDDENIMSYTPESKCRKVYYGIDNKEADYVASDIRFHKKGTSFTVHHKETGLVGEFETKLLGKHNVYNLVASIAFAMEMGIPVDKIKLGVKQLAAVEHRMEIKKKSANMTIIDDSFNSNPTGSRMALEVLGGMEGFKVLVTPGMIELGDKQYEYNKALGGYAAEACDYVILVGQKQTKPIQDGLKDSNYPDDQVYIAEHLNDAIQHMNQIARPGTIVLLENDLPDTFNE